MSKEIKKNLKIREANRKVLRDRLPNRVQALLDKVSLSKQEHAKLQALTETWGLSRIFLGNSTIPIGIFLTLASFTVMHIVVASLSLVALLAILGVVFGYITFRAAIEDKYKEIEDFKTNLLIAKADLQELSNIKQLEGAYLQEKVTKLNLYIDKNFPNHTELKLPEDFMQNQAMIAWINGLRAWNQGQLTAREICEGKKAAIDEYIRLLNESLTHGAKMNNLAQVRQPSRLMHFARSLQWSSIWNNRYWATIATFIGNFLSVLGTWATIAAIANAIVLTSGSHTPLVLWWASEAVAFMTGWMGFYVAISLALVIGVAMGGLYYWSLVKSEQRKAILQALRKQVTAEEDACNQLEAQLSRLSDIKKYLNNIVNASVSKEVAETNLETREFLQNHVQTLVQVDSGHGPPAVVTQMKMNQVDALPEHGPH